MRRLFNIQPFVSHSGLKLDWKIDCDALGAEDLMALAKLISRRFKFGSVLGIPTGGVGLAFALKPYITVGPRLIVDDVLTTGASMEEAHTLPDDIGVVIFARGPHSDWITPIFTCGGW